ncbi:MAG: hypothetical protein LKCHEGNO_01253 [Burkholderiaceae bacterium]|nr:hypothetical protein [Burkholderiaceae bacterium]
MLRMRVARRCLGAMWALVALGAAAAPPAMRFSDAWSPEDCGLFKLDARQPEALCGFVSVPLRHRDPDSPRIRLAVVVLPALTDTAQRRKDPLFLAQGGPGGTTIGTFAQLLVSDPGKRPTLDRDLVLWDQRGTYFSQPRLQCRELAALPDDADERQQADAMNRCGERLAHEGFDLSAFNSLENARDVDSVRAALGYDSFDFYGVSYGTELAQFLMRERPRGLRAVVLDAVVPIGFSLVTDALANKQQVMQRYAESCAQSKACNDAYPDLGARYFALLDRLDKHPVSLDTVAAAGSAATPRALPQAAASAAGDNAPERLTGRELDGALYQSIYMREAVPLVPYVVYRAEQGDFSFVLNFVQLMQASDSDMADAMYITVVCAEHGDTPPSALRFPGLRKRLAEEGRNDARALLATCRDWKIRLLDKALLQPVHSDIPTLLLSGRFDPITPPEMADRVAATLSRAVRFTFAGGTHGQAFTVPCANRLIAQFLDDPMRRPDGACVQEATPTFYTPDQLLRLPARLPGSASIEDHMQALAGPGLAVTLALALLFSAVPVYSVAEVVRVFRGRRSELPEGWRGRLIGAAPWVPVLGAFLLLAFLVSVGTSIGDAIERNQFLLLVGVVPAWVKSLTWALLPFVAAMALMTAALRLLWRHRARSVAGRIYYTLLVVAGWSVCLALFKTGLFGL